MSITELILTLHILIQNLIWAITFEKWAARQNDVKDDSNAKDICLAIVALLLKELWSHVAGATTPQVQLFTVVLNDCGQPEVRDFQVPVVLLRGKK